MILVIDNNNIVINCGTKMIDSKIVEFYGHPLQFAFQVNFSSIDDNELPEDFMPNKYCYTETNGFYINPDYEESNQYGIPDELLQQIKDDTIQEVQDNVQ